VEGCYFGRRSPTILLFTLLNRVPEWPRVFVLVLSPDCLTFVHKALSVFSREQSELTLSSPLLTLKKKRQANLLSQGITARADHKLHITFPLFTLCETGFERLDQTLALLIDKQHLFPLRWSIWLPSACPQPYNKCRVHQPDA
jgi:hypothetical protein